MSRRPSTMIIRLAVMLMLPSAALGCSGDDAYAGELRDEFLEACAPLGEGAAVECGCTFDRIREEYDEDRYRSEIQPAIQAGPDEWPESLYELRVNCLLETMKEE